MIFHLFTGTFFVCLGVITYCEGSVGIAPLHTYIKRSFFYESVYLLSGPAPARRHSSVWLSQLEESLSSLSGVTVTPSQSASPSGLTPPSSTTSPPLALSAVERARQRREQHRRRRRPDLLPSSDNDSYEVAGHRLRRTPSRASRVAEERRRRAEEADEDSPDSPHTE